MNIHRPLISALRRRRQAIRLREIYHRFHDFTMAPEGLYVDTLLLAERVSALPGCVIECGVWRGGMSAGLATILGPHRNYFLFDSFEGLPQAREIDGEAALRWQSQTDAPDYWDNCSAPEDFAHRAMTLASARSFTLVKGWFDTTLPTFSPPEPIAFLRLDGDWYDSTIVCLQSLFDRVTPGGIIILDDYHLWDGCSRALHDFLSRTAAVERVREFNGICFLQKREDVAAVAPERAGSRESEGIKLAPR